MSSSKKYSVSLPEDLAEAVRAQVGPGGFSAYVAQAIEQRVAMDKLREVVEDFAVDNDPLTREEVEAARALLRHDRRRGQDAAA
jgi:Arc/MetJ-type ribon-helix-helix transcriptional regulator